MRLLRTPYLLGFLSAAAILVLIGIAIILTTQRVRADSRRIAHTFAVIGKLNQVEAALLEGVGAQRSYLVTGQRPYRDLYDASRARLPIELASLITLVGDNPRQVVRARDLEARTLRRLQAAQNGVRVYEEKGLAPAQIYARNNRSLDMSREIAQRVTIMSDVERRLLQRRELNAERSQALLLALGALGIPLSLGILIGIFVLLSREVRERTRAEANAQTLNDDLECNVLHLERATADLQELSRYTGLLQSCRTIDEALAVTARTLSSLLPERAGHIYLLRASQDYAEIESSWGQHVVPSHQILAPQECWGLRRAQPYWVNDIATGTACTHVELPPAGMTANTACLPLTAQGVNLGFLYLSATGSGPLPRMSIALTAAEQLSLALHNLHLQDSLRQQSIRDALTGLYNRRYLEESLPREIARCERRGLRLAVLMLDLDNFKAFNDAQGHEGGDALLASFGRLLQSKCRDEDIACRYGGEEFTLILPEIPQDIALSRAEDIRIAVERMSVRHLNRTLDGVTVSIGIAFFPQHGSGPGELLRLADAALYRAKNNGRDRVEVYGDG
ncbi:MAG: diguanylate cyclase [Lysobacterales bacterium]